MRKLFAITVLTLGMCAGMVGQQLEEKAQREAIPATQPTGDGVGKDVYKIGGDVSAPILVSYIDPEYSDYARRKKISGICLISMVIDTNGVPRNLQVHKSLEPSLDQNAIAAVSQYRFKPAMKNGQPVPVRITIQIQFKL